MASSALWGALFGAVIGGAISLVGIWIQGRSQVKLQEGSAYQRVAREHWLRQRKLKEETYRGLAHAVLTVTGHLNRACQNAQKGETPELLEFEGAQRGVAENAWTEVQVFGSDAVKTHWNEWTSLMSKTSTAVGNLVNVLREPALVQLRLATAWNQVTELQSKLAERSQELLDLMNAELSSPPEAVHRDK